MSRQTLSASARNVYNALAAELDKHKIDYELKTNAKHPRICFVLNGENQMVIFSGSPKHDGTQKSISFLRKILDGRYQRIHRTV